MTAHIDNEVAETNNLNYELFPEQHQADQHPELNHTEEIPEAITENTKGDIIKDDFDRSKSYKSKIIAGGVVASLAITAGALLSNNETSIKGTPSADIDDLNSYLNNGNNGGLIDFDNNSTTIIKPDTENTDSKELNNSIENTNKTNEPMAPSAEKYNNPEAIVEAFFRDGFTKWHEFDTNDDTAWQVVYNIPSLDDWDISKVDLPDVDMNDPNLNLSQKLAYAMAYENYEKFGNKLFVAGWQNNPNLVALAKQLVENNAMNIFANGWTTEFDKSDEFLYDEGYNHPLDPDAKPRYKNNITIQSIQEPSMAEDKSVAYAVVTVLYQDNIDDTSQAGNMPPTYLTWTMELSFEKYNTANGSEYKLADYRKISATDR